MRHDHRTTITRLLVLLTALLALVTACGSDGSSSPTAPGGDPQPTAAPGEEGVDGDTGAGEPVAGDPLADATALAPTATFALDNTDQVNSIAMSPDGATIAVARQEALGELVTITIYDTSTGSPGASVDVDVPSLSRLHWMADNRLVASSDAEFEPVWRSWDGTTLEEFPTMPFDFACGNGQVDKNTGAIYSSDGLSSVGDNLCRFDTTNGSIVRTAEGTLVSVEGFWVRPSTGEVLVHHWPDPDQDVPSQLLTIDGATMAAGDSTVIEFGEDVSLSGTTAWIYSNPSRLEPGSIPVPDIDPRLVSSGGTIFVSANGDDDHVFVSALDGSVLGTMTAGFNLSVYADWSPDDTRLARLTLDGQVEIYEF